eukprot:gnl/Ergobibamus_cyprinoides/325.p1 GENE.gnl/Ergobibamus_cyprinoides/325~~gnl/Ergobibamus_cyprinoides/325.p1  ORF type:complete len:233 (+),score=71.53 gnl/Ergobibamus_cyprinoides/325:44-742(+)
MFVWRLPKGQVGSGDVEHPLQTISPLQRVTCHSSHVLSVAYNHDASFLATASSDHTIGVWSVSGWRHSLKQVFTGSFHTGAVSAVKWGSGPTASVLFSVGWDRMIALWDLEQPPRAPKKPMAVTQILSGRHRATDIAVSPTGTQLVASSFSGDLQLWDLSIQDGRLFVAPRVVYHSKGQEGAATRLCVGKRSIVVGSESGLLMVWPLHTPEAAAHFRELSEQEKQDVMSPTF